MFLLCSKRVSAQRKKEKGCIHASVAGWVIYLSGSSMCAVCKGVRSRICSLCRKELKSIGGHDPHWCSWGCGARCSYSSSPA